MADQNPIAGNISCNLGAIAGSGSATVTLVLQLTAQTTNTATVSMKDAAGNPITDPTPADDTASAHPSVLRKPLPMFRSLVRRAMAVRLWDRLTP